MSKAFTHPLPNVIAMSKSLSIKTTARQMRFSLRGRGDLAVIGAALGIALPVKIGTCARADDLEVLCLGPDEWLVLASGAVGTEVSAKLADVYGKVPHSLTEITAREITFTVKGQQAAELMTIGCPRDTDTIPVGEARRTVFDGATVVLWKDAEDAFRIDIWNSFGPYLAQTLQTGATELALDVT